MHPKYRSHPLDHPAFGGHGHPFGRCAPTAAGGPGEGRGPGRPRGPGRFGPPHGGGPGRGPGRGFRGPGRGEPELPGFLPPAGRASRGDVRAGLLLLLLEGPMHGYQLIAEMHERSGGHWRPSPGSVYPTLKRLAAGGLVADAPTDEGGGRGRGRGRTFQLTDEGRAEAERLAAAGTAPWDDVAGEEDESAVELRDLVMSVVEAARQVVRVADAGQATEAGRVLAEARRKLYGILAAEPRADVDDAASGEDEPAT